MFTEEHGDGKVNKDKKYKIKEVKLTDESLLWLVDVDSKIIQSGEEEWRKHRWWFVYCAGERVGYAGLKIMSGINKGIAFLSRCGILPEHRGNGLQRKLIRVRLAAAKKALCDYVITYTLRTNLNSANNLIAYGFRMYIPEEEWGSPDSLYYS